MKGRTLWDFSIPSLSQNPKKMKGGPFRGFFPKKSLTTPKKNEREDPLGFFYTQSVAKPKKMKGDPLGDFFPKKSLTTPKKMKGRTLCDFSTPSLSQNPKKIEGGPFGEFCFPKKSLAMPKKTERGTFWSRPALYVMRETYRFCSLGQQVKFEIL